MLIDIDCPNCGRHYRLNDTLRGKKVKCKECEEPFKVPAAEDEDFLDDLDDLEDDEDEEEDFAPARGKSRSSQKSSFKPKSKKRKSSGDGLLASTWDWMQSLAPSDQILIWWVLIMLPVCLLAPASKEIANAGLVVIFIGLVVALLYGAAMQLHALFQQEDVVLLIVLHFVPGVNGLLGLYLLVARWEWFGPPFLHNLKSIGIFLPFLGYFVLLGTVKP